MLRRTALGAIYHEAKMCVKIPLKSSKNVFVVPMPNPITKNHKNGPKEKSKMTIFKIEKSTFLNIIKT